MAPMIYFSLIVLFKEDYIMIPISKIATSTLKAMAESSLKMSANSTSSIIAYQPKAPVELKKFSKKNDK
mgnify:CR=1 FL=1